MAAQVFPGKGQIIILAGVWAFLQVFFLLHFGMVTQLESVKYIAEAKYLLNQGHYTSGNFLFYSVEILLISLSYISHTFPWLVVLVQICVNGISIYFFYRLCFSLTGDLLRAFFVTLFFLGLFYYQLYNVYLFTESLYYSFGILYTYLLFSVKRLSAKSVLVLLLGLAFLYFSRPTGLFFIPSTIVYLVFKFYRNKAWYLLSGFLVFGIVALYFLLNFALKSGGEFDFLLPYLDERVICGVPTIQQPHAISVPVEKNSVEGLWYIITHYPALFFGLAGRRLLAFFGGVRSYFSTPHNIFIAFYLYSTYALAIYGFKKMIVRFLPQTAYLLTNIFFVALTVMLSCDEWHNRFMLAVFPFFLLLASGAFMKKTKA